MVHAALSSTDPLRSWQVLAVEAKSGQTVTSDALKGLQTWRRRLGDAATPAALAYGGDASYEYQGITIHRWSDL